MLAASGHFRLRQQGNDYLFRLILRRSRKIKRNKRCLPPCRRPKKAFAVATA
jgi:hypothetical protein